MRNLFISLAAMVLLVAGCQKPELDGPVMDESTFVASVEVFGSQTKTAMTSDNQIVWSSGDRVVIFQGRTVADEYEIDESCVGKSNATFNPVAGEGNSSAGSELPCNVAFYPYADDLSLSGSETSYEVVYSLPSVQHYAADSFSNGAFPMMAVTKTTADHELQFKNVLGAMKLSLKGTLVVKSIKVEGNNGEKLSGAATLIAYANNLNPVITLTGTDESSKSVTLDCSEGVQLNTSTATDFIIALPPVLFHRGFTVTVTDSNAESHTITAGVANTILRSSILVMPEFVLGEFNGGEIVVPGIQIDGDFSDWDSLADVATATCDPEANWTALRTLKVCAYHDAVYIYIEFVKEEILNREYTPFHIFLDADGGAETGGVGQLYSDPACEWMLEGAIFASDILCTYNAYLWQWTGEVGGNEWSWGDSGCYGFTAGAGKGNKYELAIIKEQCPNVTWSEAFGIGVEIEQDWTTVGVLPNAACTDDNPSGLAPLLRVYGYSDNSIPSIHFIKLDHSAYALYEGGKVQLTAKLGVTGNADKTVIWSSENPAVAVVDQNGLVTAIAAGETTIYAVAGGKLDTCTITVKVPSVATEDYIDEYGINHGKGTAIGMAVWAPVNCGYHATDYKWGKLYQWGRRYGQGYSGNLYDKDKNVIGSVSDAIIPDFAEGGVSLVTGNSKNNSNVFFISNYDYTNNWLYPNDDMLWNLGTEESPIKTKYDPCPEGWRVPTFNELNELRQNRSDWMFNEANQAGSWFCGTSSYTAGVPMIFLPAAGYRNYDDGLAYGRGYIGCYWSFLTDYNNFNSFYFNCYGIWINGDRKAYGYSVRCVQNTSGEPVWEEDEEGEIPVLNVSLNMPSIKIYEDGHYQLTAKLLPVDATDQTIVWRSDNPDIAKVDQNGLVTAVSDGSTSIYAVSGDQMASCSVTVVAKDLAVATADYVDEYGVNHGKGTPVGQVVWAPVNCGYHATDYKWGKLYQWGRKYGQGYDGDATTPSISEGPVSLEVGNNESNSNVLYTDGWDWLDPHNDALWNSGSEKSPEKTEYDPCPTGWRVPTYNELNELCQNYSESTTNNANQSGLWFSGILTYTDDVPQVFLPVAGYRCGGNGEALYRDGYYWSSTFNSVYSAYSLNLYDSHAYIDDYNFRVDGYSVRCVQE